MKGGNDTAGKFTLAPLPPVSMTHGGQIAASVSVTGQGYPPVESKACLGGETEMGNARL